MLRHLSPDVGALIADVWADAVGADAACGDAGRAFRPGRAIAITNTAIINAETERVCISAEFR